MRVLVRLLGFGSRECSLALIVSHKRAVGKFPVGQPRVVLSWLFSCCSKIRVVVTVLGARVVQLLLKQSRGISNL